MYRFFSFIIAFLILCTTAIIAQSFTSLDGTIAQDDDILHGKISLSDKRYPTMKIALRLLAETGAKTIVETGTARYGALNCAGDGCSTPIWGKWAKQNGAHVFSIDINLFSIECAKLACHSYLNNVTFVCSDSIAFLNGFSKPIDFLYLDSYDYDARNPLPSQLHHLKEITAAYPFLTKKSIVMIDDCDLPGGGKGGLAINYLLERGWKIIAQAYQVILVQE